MYFGYNTLTGVTDDALSREGLGRAHHRALYFIARQPNLTVSQLLAALAITKQSLGRVLNELSERGLIETQLGVQDRRQRLLRLTPTGVALETALFEGVRARLSAAYANAGQGAVTGFWAVLEGLISAEARALYFEGRS